VKSIIYTARFGDTDALRAPLVIDPRARYLCFSDRPVHVEPYEWIRMPSAADPRLAARRVKVLADHPLLTAARLTIWHDASYAWKTSPRELYKAVPETAEVFALHHPRRFTIEQEALAIARYGYVSPDVAARYVAGYRAEGFQLDVLTCTGLLGRRQTPKTAAFNARWWTEVQRWNGRDQSSVDYAAWTAGLVIHHVQGSIKINSWVDWRPDEVPA
jgi:hypothetical protein